MTQKHKIKGEERRSFILKQLTESTEPIPARALAETANVSRQVIVQDISLLKAKNVPIIATAQGYIYMVSPETNRPNRVYACRHQPEETEKELNIMVDHGGTVLDVIVEHPIYGQITASLMVRSRKDVQQFIQQVRETNASLLSELTEGLHLHTVEAETQEELNEIEQALKMEGLLLEQEE